MRGSSSSSSSAASDSIGQLLPLRGEPMECRWFRWWASELENAGSKPGSKAKTVGRSHRKKKRSIVELFAVAPHVVDGFAAEDVEEEEEGDEEDVGSDEREELLERLTRKRSRGLLAARNGSGGVGGKLKRKSKRKHVIKRGNKLLHGSVLRRRQKKKNVPMGNKRASKVQGSPKRRRAKAIQSALLCRKKMRRSSALPTQGILKAPIRAGSVNEGRKPGRSQDSDLAVHNKSKKAKTYASFSCKNDVTIGQKKKASSHMKVTDALVISTSKDQTIIETHGALSETKICTTTTSGDTNPSSMDARKSTGEDQDNPRVVKCYDKTMNCHVDLNHSPYGCGGSPLPNNCSSVALSSNTSTSSSEILGPVARNSSESFMEYLFGGRFPVNPVTTRCSNDPPSMVDSSWSTLHGGSHLSGPWMQRIRGCDGPSCQPMHHVPISSAIFSQAESSCHQLATKACFSQPRTQLCPPTDLQNKHPIVRVDQTDTCQYRCSNGNFIGLPLNSQGEFMKLHSRDEQLKQNQNRFISSQKNYSQHSVDYWNTIDHPMNKGKLPDTSVHLKEKASQYPDRQFLQVNCIKQCQERPNTFELHVNNFNQGHYPATCRHHNLMGVHTGAQLVPMEGPLQNSFHPVNQQTMRLMGKDVTVGAGNGDFQGFLDERRWADREIMLPTRCNDSTPDLFSQQNSTPNWSTQHKWSDSWSSVCVGSNALCSMETEKNPPNFYHLAAMDTRLQHAHMEDGSRRTDRNVISFDRCHALNWGGYAQQRRGILSDDTTITSSKLMSPPMSYNSCIQIQPSTGEYPRPRIPFHDGGPNFAQGSYRDHLIFGNHTSQIVPPWLANMTSQKQLQNPSPSYSDMFSKPQRTSMAGAYPFTTLRCMEFPCSSNATTHALGPAITSIGSPVSPPFMAMQSPAMNAGHQEMRKAGFGTRPGFPRRQRQDQTAKTERRLLPKPAYFTRRFKASNLPLPSSPEFQKTAWDSLYPCSLLQRPSHVDLHDSRNKVVGIKETTRKDAITAPGLSSPKLDGEPRPGGNIDLTAGTKHVIDEVGIQETARHDAVGAPGPDPPRLEDESTPGGPIKLTAGAEHMIDKVDIRETVKNNPLVGPPASDSPESDWEPRPVDPIKLHVINNGVCNQETLVGKDAIGAYGSGSPILDREPWPGGPIKLTAGAKHTIRPSRNIDPDSYVPLHSSVPFAAGSNKGKVLEPRCKSAKVYQF